MRPDYARMARFGTVGAINTAIGYGVILLGLAAGWSDLAANAAGYAAGICIGFLLNRNWTFRASPGHGALARYVGVFAFCYGLNLAVMFSAKAFGAPAPLAHLAAIAVYSVCFYIGSARYVFAGRDALHPEPTG